MSHATGWQLAVGLLLLAFFRPDVLLLRLQVAESVI